MAALLLLLLLVMSSVSANFSIFLNSNSDIKFVGDASASTDHVDLTKTQRSTPTTHSTGKVYYRNPFRFKNSTTVSSFSTDFTYKIGVSGALAGDGMAFFIVADPRPMVGERALGLDITDAVATSPFLAVEFDTYKNNSTGDPLENHVGIDLSSMTSVATYNGSTLINLMQRAWIDYDAETELLEVRLANESSNTTALRPSVAVVSAHVNVSALFPNSDSLYVGFSAATWDAGDLYQIYSWNFNITYVPFSPSTSNRVRNTLITVIVTIPFLFICIIASVIWVRTRINRQSISRLDPQSQRVEYPFSRFRYADLSVATRRFSEKELLGKGGFGSVYKGILPADGSLVAVKVMSIEAHQQFLAELSVISRLRHKNLVSLKGWCQEHGKLILVYDYMPNGSLDKYIFSPEHFLSWSQRYEIVKGVANGLAFLHSGWDHRIVHRDIKAANVLLDINLQARLGDFGLAKLIEDNTNLQQTMTRAGTRGYMAPELAYLGKASEKSDIYSFGILLLEVACGRPVLTSTKDREFLLDWVWEAHSEDDLLIVCDPQLNSEYNEKKMKVVLSLGLLCTHPNAELRPNMRRCYLILNGEAVLPDLPSFRPTLSFGDSMPTISSSITSSLFLDSIFYSMGSEKNTVALLRGGSSGNTLVPESTCLEFDTTQNLALNC